MDVSVKKIIEEEIVPLIEQGKMALFVGAGFSIGVPTIGGMTVPSSGQLIDRILRPLNYSDDDIENAELGDAFAIGQDAISNFPQFLRENFNVKTPHEWQTNFVRYWWRRIYTTNVDNCLQKSSRSIQKNLGEDSPRYANYNFVDRASIEVDPVEIPIVSLHGTVEHINKGFVFDSIEYADASVRQSDWLRDVGLNISHGHCLFLGSRFNEPDIETALRQRKLWENSEDFSHPNWIVLRKIDRAKREWYEKRNIVPICCEIEEFCEYVNQKVKTITAGRYLRQFAPHIGLGDRLAGGWFVKSFDYVADMLLKGKNKTGVLSRFFTGENPSWYYLANEVPAVFSAAEKIVKFINGVSDRKEKVFLVAVTGGVATGKTTSCLVALSEVSEFNKAVYSFNPMSGIDVDFLWESLKDAKGIIVLYFDKASEYFFAINEIAKRIHERNVSVQVVFVVEERQFHYKQNVRHLNEFSTDCICPISLDEIDKGDATALYKKLKYYGMATGPLDGLIEGKAVELIVNKDRGFRGDLLATLCEVTSHDRFDHKIRDEYGDFSSQKNKEVYESICIVSSIGLPLPLVYLCEIQNMSMAVLLGVLAGELFGKIHVSGSNVSVRHSGIADYIVYHLMEDQVKAERIIDLNRILSSKFSIEDIRKHPLSYRIYKNTLSYRYLTSKISGPERFDLIHGIYSSCQTYFNEDGIFWLQYGRFMEKNSLLDDALHCLRKGLGLYNSFQIRHALGDVLLKKYVVDGAQDEGLYEEGVEFLENEMQERGSTDPYVPSTFADRLLDVYALTNHNESLERAKSILNSYPKLFPDDERLRGSIVRFVKLQSQ